MRWQGAKARLTKYIIPILKEHRDNRDYLEPFCGAANVVSLMPGKRTASDSNKYIISLLQSLQNGWMPPENINEQQYLEIKNNPDNFDPALTAFVLGGCSFGGKWAGGYARGESRNYAREAKNSLEKIRNNIKDVEFVFCNYWDWNPTNLLVYCDPPYEGTTGYKEPFDHAFFWNTMRTWAKTNTVIVSEQNPEPPVPVVLLWEMPYKGGIRKISGKPSEKLYKVLP